MSQAEELLNGMSEEIPVHTHPVPDTDTYFVIDPVTRKIENTNPKKHVIMQYDHNSERCTFELPRFIDGHDMLECTSVTVNVDNIEVVESEGGEVAEPRVNSDAPDMTDLRIHPNDPEKVITSWLISRNSTQLAGILSFHIEFKCVDSNGNVVYEWSTDNFNEIEVKARKKNGEAAISEYTDVFEQWRTRIFGAGDSVMANIAAEGEAQVAAVKAESTTQQEAVELKGAQTLDTIPEDYTEIDAMAEDAVRSKANAIICSVEGDVIEVPDSSDDYIRGLKIFGKTAQAKTTGTQLAYVNINVADYALKGVMCSETDDGNIVVSGTSTEGLWNRLMSAELVAGETYILSSNGALVLTVWDATADTDIATKERNVASITFIAKNTGTHTFVLSNPAHSVFSSVRANIMLNAGSVALPWEPYSGGMMSPCPEYPQSLFSIEDVNCAVYGLNLFRLQEITAVGVTGIPQADGTVRYTGTADTNAWHAYQECFIPADGTYTLSVETIGKTEKGSLIQIYDEHGLVGRSWQNVETNFSCTFNTVTGAKVRWSIGVLPDEVVNATVKLMLNPGDIVSPWKPYVDMQSISVPHTLHGIPITSGGNYTDSDGQQWICDEIDLERGVLVQRVAKHTVTGTPAFNETADQPGRFSWNCLPEYFATGREVCLCNYAKWRAWGISDNKGVYDYGGVSVTQLYYSPAVTMTANEVNAKFAEMITNGNPPIVVAQLATPIETPLTAEEISAFKALRTNYPNTTILNDAGAWMSVKYNADTKTYVENPKTLKLVDSSTGVVYELKVVDGSLAVVPVQ